MALASVVACVPLGVLTLAQDGLTAALIPGPFTTFSPWFTVLTCLVSVVALWWGTRPRARDPFVVVFAVNVLANLFIGVALLVYTRGTPSDVPYYPAKVLWHAAVLAYPVFVAAIVWAGWRIWTSERLGRMTRGSRLIKTVAVGAPVVVLLAYFGGTLTINSPYAIRHMADAGGDHPQVPLAVLLDESLLGTASQPVLAWQLSPRGWNLERPFDDWAASQILTSLGHPVPPAEGLRRHLPADVCTWLTQNPGAVRLTGPMHGERELVDAGCPEAIVHSDKWRVILTPPDWWTGISTSL
jgi:hypothetical protein